MLELLADHPFARELVISTLTSLAVYAVCAAIIVIAERRQGRDAAVYGTANALNDLAYAVFYKCSIYSLVVFPLFAVLTPRMQFLRMDPLRRLPAAVSVILCWILFDFLHYWVHRLQHASRLLWAFHSVHHTQTRLTFLTANRIHVVEQLWAGLLMMIPALLLGVPQPLWLPLLMAQTLSETLAHARLDWTFGTLRRLLVSPAMHAIHHSIDPREHHANYGRVFSLWDVVFGTFVLRESADRRYGVEGMDVPERLTAQFVHPFRLLGMSARPPEFLPPTDVVR